MKLLRPALLLWSCVMVSVLAGGVHAQTVYLKDAALDDGYIVGYFGGREGKGVIAWDAATSLGPIPLPGKTQAENAAGWNLFFATGDDQGHRAVIELESDPFPAQAFLNVSKPVHLNVYSRETARCPAFWAELFVGDQFAGGQLPIGAIRPKPAVPPGGCLAAFRIHPELDEIPQGATLKVRLYLRSGEPVALASDGSFRSYLAIPTYAPHEVTYRVRPDRWDPTWTPAEGDGIALASVVGAFILTTGGLAVDRRWRPAAVALCVVLAGCAGASTKLAPTETQQTEDVQETPDEELEPGTASLQGIVRDDFRRPIPEVRVSVLGSQYFGSTDASGAFDLGVLEAGNYEILFSHGFYRSETTILDAAPGKRYTINVTLVPLSRDPDRPPHVHNFWGDATSLLLADGPVRFGASSSTTAPTACAGVSVGGTTTTLSNGCRRGISFELDSPGVIPPGTESLEVQLQWKAQGIPLLGLIVEHPGDVSFVYLGFAQVNETPFMPRASGVPTRIPVSWEMTDDGHQRLSLWRFWIYTPGFEENREGGATNPTNYLDPVAGYQRFDGEVRIRLVAYKGTIPIDVPHPDPWQGSDRLAILPPTTITTAPFANDPPSAALVWRPTQPVPPASVKLTVKLELGSAPTRAMEAPQLLFLAANMPRASDTDFAAYRRVPLTGGPLAFEATLDVAAEMPDSFYARKSLWRFSFDDGGQSVELGSNRVAPPLLGVASVTMSAMAVKGE